MALFRKRAKLFASVLMILFIYLLECVALILYLPKGPGLHMRGRMRKIILAVFL